MSQPHKSGTCLKGQRKNHNKLGGLTEVRTRKVPIKSRRHSTDCECMWSVVTDYETITISSRSKLTEKVQSEKQRNSSIYSACSVLSNVVAQN